jgi:hypothetical protein
MHARRINAIGLFEMNPPTPLSITEWRQAAKAKAAIEIVTLLLLPREHNRAQDRHQN